MILALSLHPSDSRSPNPTPLLISPLFLVHLPRHPSPPVSPSAPSASPSHPHNRPSSQN